MKICENDSVKNCENVLDVMLENYSRMVDAVAAVLKKKMHYVL